MLRRLRELHKLLSPRQRLDAVVLFGIMLFVGVLQVGAVGSIMPFMAVAADPEIVHQQAILKWFYEWAGFESTSAVLVSLGWLVFAMVVVTNVAMAGSIWFGARFIWDIHARLSSELLRRYLARDYLWFVQQGTSEPGKNILAEAQQFTNRFMNPLLELIRNGLVAFFLLVLLTIVNWKVALIAGGVIGSAYGAIYLILRRKLNTLGVERLSANNHRFKTVQQAFGAFKDLKVLQADDYFVQAYKPSNARYSRIMALQQILQSFPRNLLEIVVFGSMVLLVIYFLRAEGGIRQIMPVLSVYAFAGYRMMPALQRCFRSLASLRFTQHLVEVLYRELDGYPEPQGDRHVERGTDEDQYEKLAFQEQIRFDHVEFSYSGNTPPALSDIDLVIPRGHMVALCGETGSGKTTIANLLLGLFIPKAGSITIDGIPLDRETIGAWRRNVGYVPQDIFVTDDSITRNIAFGVDDAEIDMEAVENAAKMAQIHGFITEDLAESYETIVGERGVRLSGGQRQRLGIARALYHNPTVLVFDEATSALDSRTEHDLMQQIRSMVGLRTIVIIAHRLTTVENCDEIYVLEKGRIVAQGSYPELVDGDYKFRRLAGIG